MGGGGGGVSAAQPQGRWQSGLGSVEASPPGKQARLNWSAPWRVLPGGSRSQPRFQRHKLLLPPAKAGVVAGCPPRFSAESAASKSPCGLGREPAKRPWASALCGQAEEWVHGPFPAAPHPPLLLLGSTPTPPPCSQDGCVEACLELAFCRCLHVQLHVLASRHLHQAQVSGSEAQSPLPSTSSALWAPRDAYLRGSRARGLTSRYHRRRGLGGAGWGCVDALGPRHCCQRRRGGARGARGG